MHPGHVRHLLYAKSKASVLIASLTADRHIDKGMYRPHVPQDLRALNLAAFDMIDYVIIDENATPLENLRVIQPDFFAKGYEERMVSRPAQPRSLRCRGLRWRAYVYAGRHRLIRRAR